MTPKPCTFLSAVLLLHCPLSSTQSNPTLTLICLIWYPNPATQVSSPDCPSLTRTSKDLSLLPCPQDFPSLQGKHFLADSG